MNEKQRATRRAWFRRRYEARVAEGVCITCGGDLAPESRWKCRPCLDANSALQMRKRALRPIVRFCACGAVLGKRRQLCDDCKQISEARRRAATLARMRLYNLLRRDHYAAAQSARYARRRQAGICYTCGEPSSSFVYCRLCRLLRSRKRRTG